MLREIEWDLAPGDWRALVERCPRATIYHTPGWSLTQRDHGGYALHTARFVFADGRQALLPLATRKRFRGLLREAMSGLEGGYGGLTATAPLSQAQVEEVFRRVRQRFGDLVVTGSPHEAFPNVPAGKLAAGDPTQVVPIRDKQAQLAAMSETRRGSLRRSGKEGYRSEVIVSPMTATIMRNTPCVLGWCGPMFTISCSVLNTGSPAMSTLRPMPAMNSCSDCGLKSSSVKPAG